MRVAVVDAAEAYSTPIALREPAAITSLFLARAVWQLHYELQRGDDYTDMIVEGLAYELAGRTLRGAELSGGSRRRAFRAQTLMQSSLRRPLASAVIAAELGISRATLYRDFKCTFGCSPGEYLRQARIVAAVDALSKSRRTLAEIAADCGFYDQSHFDRCFRSALGVSPSEYRRSVR